MKFLSIFFVLCLVACNPLEDQLVFNDLEVSDPIVVNILDNCNLSISKYLENDQVLSADLISIFKNAADNHNENLDLIYKYLSNKNSNKLNRGDMFEAILNTFDSYELNIDEIYTETVNFYDQAESDYINYANEIFNIKIGNLISGLDLINGDNISADNFDDISDQSIQFLVEYLSTNNFTEEDEKILTSITGIQAGSYLYWSCEINIQKWKELNNTAEFRASWKEFFRKLVNADTAGGAAGATMSSATGGGLNIVPSTVIGGASASAMEGASYWF